MSAAEHIPLHILEKQLLNALEMTDHAPEGAFEEVLDGLSLIEVVLQIIEQRLKGFELYSTPDVQAGRNLAAYLYGYIKAVNADRTIFATAEFFGAAMSTDEKDAMIARVAQAVGITTEILGDN